MDQTPITASNIRVRKSFARNKQLIDIPNLIELQKSSYEAFLQKDVPETDVGVGSPVTILLPASRRSTILSVSSRIVRDTRSGCGTFSKIKRSVFPAVTGADDLVTATIDWAPQNFTVYVRFARPPWALATAPAGLTSNYLFSLGSSGAVFEGYWSQTASLWYAAISNGTTAVSATRAMPSGSMLEFCAQFDAVTTGARVRLDIGDGAGFSAYSSATGGVSAWGSSTFRVGHLNSAPVSALDSGIRKLVIAPGARTLAEMRGLNV
jgi:hypothetical protein